MSTSGKLSYLLETKSKIKEAINSDFDLVDDSTTFREYSDKIKSNNDNLKEFIPVSTGTGKEVTISDSAGLNLRGGIIEGNAYQYTTNGYQLLDFANPTQVLQDTTSTFIDDTLIVSNSTGSYRGTKWDITDLIKNNPGKSLCLGYESYKTNSGIVDISLNTNEGLTYPTLVYGQGIRTVFTIPQDISNIISVTFRVMSNNSSTSQKATTKIVKPILYIGALDNPPAYEKYTSAEPSPSPNYPQEIKVVKSAKVKVHGKNLIDANTLMNNDVTIQNVVSGKWYKCSPNTEYTISTNIVSSSDNETDIIPTIGEPTNQNAYVFILTDKEQISISSINNGVGTLANKTRTVITNDSGDIFIGVRRLYKNNLFTLVEQGGFIQLEKGLIATDFEPYQEPQEFTIGLQDNEMLKLPNGVKDEISIDKEGNVNLIKRTKKYKLSLLDWSKAFCYYAVAPDLKEATGISIYCKYFKSMDNQSNTEGAYKNGNNSICQSNFANQYRLYIRCDELSEVEELTDFLSTNDVYAYYKRTEQIINLGKLDIKTYPKTTIFELITEDIDSTMSLEIYRDYRLTKENDE